MTSRSSATIATLALIAVAAAGAVAYYDFSVRQARLAEGQALRARVIELANRTIVQGSPLACLAGDVGDAVETACEKLLFARPETVAAAIAFTAVRMSLIADGLDYAKRAEPSFTDTLNGIRRAVELDRFGLAAQVLSTRDGCTVDTCAFFALTRDPSVLKANIKARAYDEYVSRYAASWNAEEKPAANDKPAGPAPAPEAAAPQAAPPVHQPVANKYNFPSAASIPPVSIMNAEPALPPDAAKAKAEADKTAVDKAAAERGVVEKQSAPLPLPARRPQTEAAVPPAR
ncbi:MAG: hypothetical protein JO205_05110 [Pseudolabrys sp.]|nr:hypothetical protein [Pseudolabrys sp.]MBV9260730.1 hypothetical protein [Pseudolabrys sp.]